MKRSTERILTTHCGSLARPHDLLALMQAKETVQPYDHEDLARRVRSAVADIVQKQVEHGVDIVCDGEQSKAGFSVYVRERLTGFEPRSVPPEESLLRRWCDVQAFPEYYEQYFKQHMRGIVPASSMVCVGPVAYKGQAAVQTDIENLKAALQGVQPEDVFMPAIAPRSLGKNEHYPTDEAYISAIADAMREEYQAIVDAGFILQIDDPALTNLYGQDQSLSLAERHKRAELYIEALNHALWGIPHCGILGHGPTSSPVGEGIDELREQQSREAHVQGTWVSSPLLAALLLALAGSPHAQTPPQNAAADLGGTSWQLVQFQGSDDTTLTPDNKAKYTIAFGTDGRVSTRINCNRGSGTWKSPGPHQRECGPPALTRAMCPPAPLNDRIVKDWEFVRSYTIKDGHLFLSLMADGGNYEFEPASLEGSVKGAVKGTATYRERMVLPPDAVFEATLEDVSKTDAVAEVIGLAHIEGPGNPPIRFEIMYNPSRIHPSHRYVIRARVLVDGKLFFITDQHYPVLTAGRGNEVELLLRRAGAASPAGGASDALGSPPGTSGGEAIESLENTYWKLTRLGNALIAVATQQREPHLILNSETRRVSGSGGCNQLIGSYELNGDQLTLGQMAGTMMACPEGMETEKIFLEALQQVSRWQIAGQHLDLFDAAGNAVAHFEARHVQ